jgi:hypothetical protein
LPSFTVQTALPRSPLKTAACGTTTARSSPAWTCARTNCPGSTSRSGFANSARSCTVPSCASTVEPAKLSLPAPPSGVPSADSSFTALALPPRSCASSLSENEKRTQIGSVWVTRVRRPSLGLTRLPCDFSARPVMPVMGETTRVYERLSSAWRNCACACATLASATRCAEAASSKSFWLTACCSISGPSRFASRRACSSLAPS